MSTAGTAERGRASFAQRAWTDAYTQLSAADRESPLPPEDLEQLVTAAYLIGKDEDSADLWARAHHGFASRGEVARAPRNRHAVAVELAFRGLPESPWYGASMSFGDMSSKKTSFGEKGDTQMRASVPLQVLGLMSGTSADGVDAVLARFALEEGQLAWEVLARHSQPYPAELRGRLLEAMKPESSDVVRLTQLHTELGEVYAGAVRAVQRAHAVDLVAMSGQTVYHIPRLEPERGWRTRSTLQLGEAAVVAEQCRVPVFSDFRQSDMAAGGQGAPMVSFGDLMLFHEPGSARAVHNLGGIANLTYLPADGDPEGVFAFDTGPASCLLDEAAARDFGRDYDEGGALAAKGNVDEGVLERLLAHPYFRAPPPKTTGREVFTLSEFAAELAGLKGHDLLATLSAFTSESVARAYRDFVLPKGLDELLVAGGGALNGTLLAGLRERLPVTVTTFEEQGWQSRDREALAFAVMAYYAWHGLPNTLPRATGARRAVVAGKLSRPWLE